MDRVKQFEYKTIVTKTTGFSGGVVDAEDYDRMLNGMGALGWELVSAVASNQSYGSTRCILTIFKRER